jgi:hypothetical protein
MLNFKYPYIWAPFVMAGNGSMKIKSSKHEALKSL